MVFVNKQRDVQLLQQVILVAAKSCKLPEMLIIVYEISFCVGQLTRLAIPVFKTSLIFTGKGYSIS